jgi:peptidoglycan/LPS O-acetylase OafA/YrhL
LTKVNQITHDQIPNVTKKIDQRLESITPPTVVSGSSTFRPDIQGLRAIAVMLVVLYHLAPSAVPGGFIGVDVFFVISGYLISRLLLRAMQRTGRVRFVDFYGRRVRRLIPSSVLVLVVTAIASRLILPASQLAATATQIRASALYMQNWVLAHDAVNYLKASQAPTPVQHFWSLSLEEQFYLLWPLLFLIAGFAAAALIHRNLSRQEHTDLTYALAARRAMLGVATVVFIASLAWSAHDTAANQASAYFVTTTRMWELAAGGVLALIDRRIAKRLARVGILGWAGLAMVIISAFVINGSSRVPGTIALLPVLGTVLLISSGSRWAKVGPSRLTSHSLMIFLGNISYSLYLWHWPVIVLWRARYGDHVSFSTGLLLIAISVGLAWFTTQYVEDRVRLGYFFRISGWRSVATLSVVAVPALMATIYLGSVASPYSGQLDAEHPGAAVLAGTAKIIPPSSPIPAPIVAAHDLQLASNPRCLISENDTSATTCSFGDLHHPTKTIALVGDSIAGEWSSSLAAIATQQRWKLVTILKSGCPWTATAIDHPGTTQEFTACHTWSENALHTLLDQVKPDVVVTSDWIGDGTAVGTSNGTASYQAVAHGMTTYWDALQAAGIRIVAIQEGPTMSQDIPDCLTSHGATVAGCSTPRNSAITLTPPTVLAAHEADAEVPLVNMNDLICGRATCLPIVGNVVVYRDSHHLTNTYSRTLTPYLEGRLLGTKAFSNATGSH